MYGGNPPPFRHQAPPQQQPSQPPPQQQHVLQFNPNNYFPNPNLFMLPHINPFLQNPSTFSPPIQHQFNPNLQPQRFDVANGNNTNNNSSSVVNKFPQQQPKLHSEMVEKVDRAVTKARRDLLASNENVSSWKVSQAALLTVKADSWEGLGFHMQQVPSLKRLLVTEGKINAFMHCFVAARRITSLYDLEMAICESEGIERFEDLELGPLVRHPLAVHYFSVTSDVTETHRIRTEEIVSYLCEFLDTKKRKEVHQVDKFLDFICKKQSVSGREKLCVRIQSFGTYINHIRKTMQSEDLLLEKCYEKIRKKPKQSKKRPLFSAQKKEMDDHFTAISQRMQSFSSENTQFCGKHIRFVSSSSEDNDSESNEYEDNQDQKNTGSTCSFSLSNVRSDRASSCPYPSATEEMTRLGLKSEVDRSPCTPGVSGRSNAATKLSKRKRGSDNIDSSTLLPRQPPKKFMLSANIRRRGSGTFDHSLSKESLMAFVATWKEACRVNNEDEVLERMLLYYKTRKRNKVKELFTLYPFVGLLNIAVTCIKLGMWDNIYDTLHTVSQENEDDKPFDCSADYISIDTQPAVKDVACSVQKIITHKHNVTAEDIVKKIIAFFEDEMLSCKNPSRESKILLLTKICKCEYWLIEQYSVDKFESLGYGEYLIFLKKYMHLLPPELQKCMIGDTSENVSLEAHLLPIELDVLLSQASNSLWENKSIIGENISELLVRQFPLVCFKLVNSDLIENSKTLREERCNRSSNCVLFSTPLLRPNCMGDMSAQNERNLGETNGFCYNTVTGEGFTAAVSTRDAIEVLLKAPMLTDLKLWMHWDLLFAPCLGSIVKWLLEEVNIEELLCLVTKDGKVIRLDHSATVDSFLKAFIGGSPFQTALEMLSLFALYGGERNVPLSLLKCHARQAFEVMINNYVEMELLNEKNLHMYQKLSTNQQIAGESISSNLLGKLANKVSMLNKAAPVVSKFVLDCLSHLPIEFCGVAADVLIAGLQPFVMDVPSAILAECKQTEQRVMLHEVGMSLGLMEWVNDYNSFRCSPTGLSHGSSCLDVVSSEFNTKSIIVQDLQDVQDKHPSSTEVLSSCEVGCNLKCKQATGGVDPDEVLVDSWAENSERLSILDDDPARVIESIRKEEFGLDQSLSGTENRMLEKQHARLGRALHCLSQELYSQDSHFLLELVQNADDNIYPENVEPTLTFIILEEGIVVLNNEQGFQANNIRALCDVGNSTKKGHNAGYIGKKGIGFKSVFRVTDAPEIHSNGFHIKFDITEGQIGFILPTLVPPRDIDCYTRFAFADADRMNLNSWNTCIVLPFRLDLSEGFAKNNILVMFADLHPSLLLFLHRLRCIMFRNTLDGTFTVMRKKVLGHGIIEVALGNEKMTWFVVSRELKADVIRSDVQTTEISVALTLQETDEGGYVPILQQQPVFAFLPLRTYGLKFILQGDFVLPSSREEVDGNSPWNQWLLSEFPDLFVSAERSFCDLPCYRGSPGKAITVFMSFVPLAGDVHGFFASLPRMVISKLRMSNCLILEGDENEWVPPCKVMRNWTDQAQSLLPDNLLHEHLGLGYLSKDVIISDSLARALGIEDYGPKVLLRVISSLCRSQNFLKSLGLSWLSSWLSTVYVMSSQWSVQSSLSFGTESDFIYDLQKIPFIPLSDGNYGSLNEGTIWLHSEAVGQGISDECLLEAFPKLYSKLRIVNPNLLAAAASIQSSSSDISTVENVTRMLYKVGVQRLFAHDIVKVQILPAVSDFKNVTEQDELMTEYLAFAMFHLQSSCTTCGAERGAIFAELREKALILTNYGYRRSIEVPIHFSLGYGSNIDVNKLISGLDMKWHEIETVYLKHPITISIPDGVLKWRNFFHEIGVTDFVQVVQTEKSVPNTSLSNFKDTGGIRDMISTDSVAKNWESEELFHLVSCISSGEDGEKSKYLLGILDKLWDDYFGDKVTGQFIDSTGECKPFNSSLISILQDSSWIVSSSDNKLHYPIDLFHDCVAVNLVLGVNAPYTIPKVRSENLAMQIGLKTQVTLDDALSVLRLWRASKSSFIASVSQMSQFYTFLWKGMALAKKKVLEELLSGPFIFVPNASSSSHDVVPGVLLSPEEVYWHDSIGLIDQTESVHPDCVTSSASSPHRKMLHNIYPNLHDFFVQECRVDESPPSRSYVQILLHLSTIALPHQVAKRVCEVLLMWGEALKSGSLSVEDVEYLKESLLKKECTVLPTRQDKWVSLHTSFGLICWCDDDNLGREFGHLGGVDFLYLGKSSIEENQMLQTKVSAIMQVLGIPALSKIVTREAIYYGPADSSFIYSLVNWVLPYAQRYIYSSHHDKYFQLKQTDFENLRLLKIVVVENLFYRNVIKKWEISSKKRHACNCLLKENILYCSQESDPHSIFLEFSCLLYGGTPELHFANFLHMITTMAESGATEEQTEFFILNSQKVPKLPADEPRWSLQSASLENSVENSLSLEKVEEEQNSLVLKRKAGNGINSKWPPADWKTAPGFSSVTAPAGNHQIVEGNKSEKNPEKRTDMSSPAENVINNIEMEVDDPTTFGLGEGGALLLDAELSESTHANLSDLVAPDRSMNILRDLHPLAQQQAMLTGKHGEQRAFEYFVGQVGEGRVKWVNEACETGLPYDIVFLGGGEGDDDGNNSIREYIEVKATKSATKNWFAISMREWQFAVEKGESFSIAHVVLADDNMTRITVYKNPARLCQLGNIKLALMVPKQ